MGLMMLFLVMGPSLFLLLQLGACGPPLSLGSWDAGSIQQPRGRRDAGDAEVSEEMKDIGGICKSRCPLHRVLI